MIYLKSNTNTKHVYIAYNIYKLFNLNLKYWEDTLHVTIFILNINQKPFEIC